MKSLIKFKNSVVKLCQVPLLEEVPKDHILIKVKSVGLCRTDLFVANGSIKVNHDLVLGHEFSGIVVLDHSNTYAIGQKVVVNPLYPDKKFMGLDFDGALTEYIAVPMCQVVPTTLEDFTVAAYLEPVAASMAVLKANINKSQKGAVYGNNRIAQLTYIILQSFGYQVDLLHEEKHYEKNSYDYIVETLFEESHLETMLDLIKEQGLLVVKSRKKQGVPISSSVLVSKEITMQAVNYYDFQQTMTWLEDNFSLIMPLLGESYTIDEWETAFKAASLGESKKIFINFD